MIGSTKTSVASRFVSQAEIDASRSITTSSSTTTAEEYDPRSLFERLQAHKEAKDAALDEKYKLSNQFRGIDEGESDFLAQVEAARKAERCEKEKRDSEELQAFRAAKASAAGIKQGEEVKKPPTKVEKQASGANPGTPASSAKKKRKANPLLGVIKKKPANTTTKSASTGSSDAPPAAKATTPDSGAT
ncbi:related to NEFA-interacting nuclear protein NIP30 [Sporisorium scitamineum]|uniref:Related to NEFA-interacting nuclear protein NIP30 n=1 Tax=Sporisorium scitamineum TaxID=49012 RepID=A0A127Z7U8_9BASI|nr:related to NEFA-interacting nuclear protein NIP30 [Sporisorium scitamineum]